MNVGVKALLNWANATIGVNGNDENDIRLEDFQNGELLLKLVYILKDESNPCCNCVEDRFNIISDFVERDCSFIASNGTPISWTDIKNGSNLTVEITKVLLLLVYHDIMSDHRTLGNIDRETENLIAFLTETYVMESEGSVSLKPELDRYLSRKYLPVAHCDFDKSVTTSVSSVSTTPVSSVSSYGEYESPLFVRSQKVKFVDLHCVASSSISSSPLQNIMNTPKFQMKKLQRQLIEERDYRDGLEKELSQKLELLTQRDLQINRMQYNLDKFKKDQDIREQIAKEQAENLENKNNQLQSRFDDVLKQNKELKGDAALMEREVDKLVEENGVLSTQMRSMSAKLTDCQAEVGWLKESRTSNEEEWRNKITNLQSQLNDERAKQEDLIEQIEILKGMISCLEDKITSLEDQIKRSKQQEGDNLFISVEKLKLEEEIKTKTDQMSLLKNQSLEQSECLRKVQENLSLKEKDFSLKLQEIADLQTKVSLYEDELKTQRASLQSKEEIFCQLKKETCTEIENLKAKNLKQTQALQQEIQSLHSQVQSLVESLNNAAQQLQVKEEILARKEVEISALKDEINALKWKIHANEEQMFKLRNESDSQSNLFHQEKLSLRKQLDDMADSLSKAEERAHSQLQMHNVHKLKTTQEQELLQQKLGNSQDLVRKLEAEICDKEHQMAELKTHSLAQSKVLMEQKEGLQRQLESLAGSLKDTEDKMHFKESLLTQQQQETKQRQQELCDLQVKIEQIEEQMLSIKKENNQLQLGLCEKDALLGKTQEQCEVIERELSDLKNRMAESNEEVLALRADAVAQAELICNMKQELLNKDNILNELKEQSSQTINSLQQSVESLKSQLEETSQKLVAKEEQLLKIQQETSQQSNSLNQELASLNIELSQHKELHTQVLRKNEEILEQLSAAENLSNLHQQEKLSLRKQLDDMADSLSKAEERAHSHLQMHNEHKLKTTQEQEQLQQKLVNSQAIVRKLEVEMSDKEHQMAKLKTHSLEQSKVLMEQKEGLQGRLESLAASLKDTEDKMHFKESLLTQQQQETKLKQQELCDLQVKIEQIEEQMLSIKKENNQQQLGLCEKDALLGKTLEQCEVIERELSDLKTRMAEKNEEVLTLRADAVAQAELICNMKQELLNKDMLNELKEQSSQTINTLQQCVESLKSQLEETSQKLVAKEEQLLKIHQESSQQIDNLSQELASLNTELGQHKELHAQVIKKNEEMLDSTTKERDFLIKDKETLNSRILFMEKQLADIISESQKEKEKMEDINTVKDLLEQLSAADNLSNLHQQEKLSLKKQLDGMADSLSKAEERAQSQIQEQALLQQKLVASQAVVRKLEVEISETEHQMAELKTRSLEQSKVLVEQKEGLQKQLELLTASVKDTEDKMCFKEKQLVVIASENQKLSHAKLALERENEIAQNLQTKLQQELQIIKQEKDDHLKEKENMENIAMTNKDLLEKLSAKSTAVEHYKAQMDKAVSHYNSKKLLLQQSEDMVTNLKQSLEAQEQAAKAATVEKKILQMELDKKQSDEKVLLSRISSLEAQLSYADKALREQNNIQHDDRIASQSMPSNLDLPSQRYGVYTRAKVRSMSSDSLDQSSADDSLNNTSKLCAPDESSTPLLRSSERLAAKRQGLKAESLETLYFTPINTRQRVTTDSRPEASVNKNSASSVKRRRTTQVINITMAKKTPGCKEGEDTFYSLSSARSHPNLSSAHRAQGISTELFATPGKGTGLKADQLIGLPGYRRSTIHSQATSTFCVGAENEPEGGPEDWMRIAEIQARNKACLPHLKSSYPLEFDTVRNSALMFTDEELRTGDPVDTIRRASMMPGQLQDSLASHRLSYMVGQSGAAATARSRLSLMPGQDFPEAVSSTLSRTKSSKRAPSTSIYPTSPEKKVKASCFPRPLTPKNKNVVSGLTNITVKSPVDRRQSMVFTIDNTPRKGLIKKGLSKPRSRKSPMVTNKGQKKSAQVSTRAAKSPGLTASARKESESSLKKI